MKTTNHPVGKIGFLLCCASVLALSGCVTYVEQPPPRTVYVAPVPPPVPPPAPSHVYAPSHVGRSTAPAVYAESSPGEAAPAESAVMEVRSVSDFYQPLSPYGQWVVLGSYGRCWKPTHIAAGWRPYTSGHWERTDAGWYWVSAEPWAWATYHYGRWDWTAQVGWFWVPRTQWAPAWVAWRQGDGYIGWAPLPPTAVVALGGAVELRDAAFATRAFVFVAERLLLEPIHPGTLFAKNTVVLKRTVNITKIRVVNRTVHNEGPRPEAIERMSGRKIRPVAYRELRHREEAEEMTRRRNFRMTAEKHAAPPPVERATGKGVLPHSPERTRSGEPVREAHPTLSPERRPGVNTPEPAPRPALHQQNRPVLNGTSARPLPAASRPEFRPEPKPVIRPEEVRHAGRPPAEKPKETQSPRAMEKKHEARAPKPAVPARPEVKKPQRAEQRTEFKPQATRPVPPKQPPLRAGQKQAERQMHALKRESAEKQKAAKKGKEKERNGKERNKKGEQPGTNGNRAAKPR